MTYPSLISGDDRLRELAMAVARNRVGPNDPIDEVLALHHTTPADFITLAGDPVFKKYVQGYVREFTENGFSFAAKCRVLAEDVVQDLYVLAKDVDAPAASRVKAVENLVDWANLAPKQTIDPSTARPTFSLTINLPITSTSAPMTFTTAIPEPVDAELLEMEADQ